MGAGQSTVAAPFQPPKQYSLHFQLDCEIALEQVINAAEDAGREILRIYNGSVEDWGVELKADSSPLTIADTEANRVICNALAIIDPHIPIVSEEQKNSAWEVRQKYQYFWLVDPIDGTKEFLKRNGQFTVNIALLNSEGPVLGVVHVPCSGKTYWSVEGRGAWVRENGQDKRIKCAEFSLQDPGLVVVGSASHMSEETQEFVALLQRPVYKQLGSSLKLVLVAEGQAHLYPRMAPTQEWDTAAADAIVREAGGAVLQAGACTSKGEPLEDWRDVLQKKEPLQYNKQDLLNPFFVCFGVCAETAPPAPAADGPAAKQPSNS